MRDKGQEFGRETTVSFDGNNFQQGTVGKKISLRTLNHIVFKLYLGRVIAGDLHLGYTSN